MNNNETKLTREELLEKLRNKKKQSEMIRMTKKNKDVVLEKFQTQAKLEQEKMTQERENMMEELKKFTPEQLKQLGLDDKTISHIISQNAECSKEQVQEKEQSSHTTNNMFNIPDISLSKMTPVNMNSTDQI